MAPTRGLGNLGPRARSFAERAAVLAVAASLVLAGCRAPVSRAADEPAPAARPALPEAPTASLQLAAPTPIVGVFPDTAPMQLPSAAREEFAFTTIAYAPHDILIAAGEKADESIGVLYFLQGGADGYEAHLYRYPGRGPIVLESLVAGDRVVTFRWGDAQPGFFDLESGAASFTAYAP